MKLPARIISQLTRFLPIEIHRRGHRQKMLYRPRHGGGYRRNYGNRRRRYAVSGRHVGRNGKGYGGKDIRPSGNRVIVSSGAKVLGPFKVGDDVKIGSGSIVLKEVPPGCTVVGIPGKVVKRYGESTEDLNQVNPAGPDRGRAGISAKTYKAVGVQTGPD